MYIWFTAQTGVADLVQPQAPSNYHRFKLPRSRLAKIEMEVSRAVVGSAGLEYSPGFYTWLASAEIPER